jgi:uncharacterized membrane protein
MNARLGFVLRRLAAWLLRGGVFVAVAATACAMFLLAYPYVVTRDVMVALSAEDRAVNLLLVNTYQDGQVEDREPPNVMTASCVLDLEHGPIEGKFNKRAASDAQPLVGSLVITGPSGAVVFDLAEAAIEGPSFQFVVTEHTLPEGRPVTPSAKVITLGTSRAVVMIRRGLVGPDATQAALEAFALDRCHPLGRLRLPVKRLATPE